MREVLTTLIVFLALASGAWAQDTAIHVVNWYDTLSPFLLQALGIIITAIVAWIANELRKRFGFDMDARAREAIHSAAMTGASLAVSRGRDLVSGVTIDTKSEMIAAGAEWVRDSVPKSLKRLGIDPSTPEGAEKIAGLVESKLPVAEAVATAPVVASHV